MMKFVLASIGVALTATLMTGAVAAAHYSLFGQAEHVSPGAPGSNTAVSLTSDFSDLDAVALHVSGISLDVPDGLTFADLTHLSLDYNIGDDGCAPDSPRFQISLDIGGDGGNDGYVDVYIGPGPDFTDCETGWNNSGNLIANNDAGRYNASQMVNGFIGSHDDVLAAYGSAVITGFVQLTVDGGWQGELWGDSDERQEILADNVIINGDVFTFEIPEDGPSCKNDGWQDLTRADSTPFKNQGECIRYVNAGK
jgi:hypothetical protein